LEVTVVLNASLVQKLRPDYRAMFRKDPKPCNGLFGTDFHELLDLSRGQIDYVLEVLCIV